MNEEDDSSTLADFPNKWEHVFAIYISNSFAY